MHRLVPLLVGLAGCDQIFSTTPPQPPEPLPDVTRYRLATSFLTTCAIRPDETLWCWGGNDNYALGVQLQETPRPVQVNAGAKWARIALGLNHACGIQNDASLWCWGRNDDGQLGIAGAMRPLPMLVGDQRWKQVSLGARHTCGVREDSTVGCWGDADDGQLGDATLGEPGWSVVATGGAHSCGIRDGDQLWCWGDNEFGQLGIGTKSEAPEAPRLVGGGYRHVGTGDRHTCALRSDGALACWGNGSAGQLGTGALDDVATPTPIDSGSTDWAEVAAGLYSTCARRTDGSLWCWGFNSHGQVGDGPSLVQGPQRLDGAAAWAEIAPGAFHTCALAVDDAVWCVGSDGFGQLGTGVGGSRLRPQRIDGGWSTIVAGAESTCALDGTGVACWGDNRFGQLGIGTTDARQIPTATGGPLMLQLAVGNHHACALDVDGRRWCWGANDLLQLGLAAGMPATVTRPTLAPGTFLMLGRAKGDHMCATDGNQNVLCWGANGDGQLGIETSSPPREPRPLPDMFAATEVDTGTRHSCARGLDAKIYCWGYNGDGQLGDGGTVSRPGATIIADTRNFSPLYAGNDHTCAQSGTSVFCWGKNTDGQLGLGHVDEVTSPTPLAMQFQLMALGANHACGITTANHLYCWGDNLRGQVGDGTFEDRMTPTLVDNSLTWEFVTAGARHTCARTTEGVTYCWGESLFGQIGDGLAWRSTLAAVEFP